MGFLDWLTGKIECPSCGTRGAKEIKGRIHCSNPACAYFSKATGKRDDPPDPSGFDPPVDVPVGSIAIRYRNFRGLEKTFVAQAGSARRTNNHISVTVAPHGARISLSRDGILNLNEVEAALPQRDTPGQDGPTPRERQVLNYHKNRGTTSPLCESIRAKYRHDTT